MVRDADTSYEEEGNDYPIGYVRWTERRNMEAFLDLVSSGQINLTPLLQNRYSVEQAASAYANLNSGTYTSIIEYPQTSPLSRSAHGRLLAPWSRRKCGSVASEQARFLPAL